MLKIEQEHKLPIDPNSYQIDYPNSNLQEPRNNQVNTNFTPQIIEINLSKNNIYRNTTNNLSLPKEKVWKIPFLEKTQKRQKFSITRS